MIDDNRVETANREECVRSRPLDRHTRFDVRAGRPVTIAARLVERGDGRGEVVKKRRRQRMVDKRAREWRRVFQDRAGGSGERRVARFTRQLKPRGEVADVERHRS